MNSIIKLLDPSLEYIKHEILDNRMYIEVISNRKEAVCLYCKASSAKVHSHYKRSFQDMPIQGIKVIIILNNRKMFCMNSDCKYKTFAESFEFLYPKAKKSKRLEKEIINLAINVSSISASSILKSHVADVGKSTICSLLKKI